MEIFICGSRRGTNIHKSIYLIEAHFAHLDISLLPTYAQIHVLSLHSLNRYRAMPIRSGRFSVDNNATDRHTIVLGRKSDAIIRVFNSGYIPFKVIAGVGQAQVLSPSYSYDVMGGSASTAIKIEALKNGVQQGIYEHLVTTREIRSGRFNTNNTRYKANGTDTFAVDDALLIADLRALDGGKSAYYRFFNSGDVAFGIYLMDKTGEGDAPGGAGGAVSLTILDPDQSLDVAVSKTNGAIWVKSQVAGKPIEGIYDFLDRD